MKCLVAGLLILMCSCKDHPQSLIPENLADPVWNIYDSTAQIDKYLPSGLLDSSLSTWYRFQNGTPVDQIITLITRSYDAAGKLTEERSFGYSRSSHQWYLYSKNSRKYDANGNKILDVDLHIKGSGSVLYEMIKLEYNQKNQEIHRMEIRKDLEDTSNMRYDTSMVSSFYDSDGNLVKEIYGDREHPNHETLSTIYAQGTKKITYGINPKGDTILIYRYEKEGNLVKQTTEYRKPVFDGHCHTIWYSGNKTVKDIDIDEKLHFRMMTMYGYDEKGNETYEVHYQ